MRAHRINIESSISSTPARAFLAKTGGMETVVPTRTTANSPPPFSSSGPARALPFLFSFLLVGISSDIISIVERRLGAVNTADFSFRGFLEEDGPGRSSVTGGICLRFFTFTFVSVTVIDMSNKSDKPLELCLLFKEEILTGMRFYVLKHQG